MDKPTKPLSHLKLGNIEKGWWWWKDCKSQKSQGYSYKILFSRISEAPLLKYHQCNYLNISLTRKTGMPVWTWECPWGFNPTQTYYFLRGLFTFVFWLTLVHIFHTLSTKALIFICSSASVRCQRMMCLGTRINM